jgi:hypothetical protein
MAPVLARNMAENVVPVLESVVDLIPAVNNSVLRGNSLLLGLYRQNYGSVDRNG